MKRTTILLLIALGVAAAGGVLWLLGDARQRGNDRHKMEFARSLVQAGRAEEAIALISSRRPWPGDSPQHRAWMSVAVEALQQVGDAVQLGQIYYDDPSLLDEHEEASLLAARALILRDDMNSFERLRSQWRGREESPHAWLILEADSLLRRSRRAQALALLTENRLDDRWESSRHVRLALLNASEPEEAWRHLAEAIRNDPEEAVARLFRAQLLEAAGRLDEARLEYVAARLAQPTNAAFCDQLAEFYRRRGAFQQMLDTWRQAEGPARADFIDLKLAFWSRVALPVEVQGGTKNSRASTWLTAAPPTAGPLQGLIRHLSTVQPEEFWRPLQAADDSTHRAARSRPEAHWLEVLQMILEGNERSALTLLSDSSTAPWETELRRSLRMTLNLRLYGELDPDAVLRNDSPIGTRGHTLLDDLNRLHAEGRPPSGGLRAALIGPHGPSLVLMSHGWLRAAVLLDDPQPLRPDAPAWAAYGMTQARRLVLGAHQALQYARRQPDSPELQLLQAELLIETEQFDEALEQLAAISDASEPVVDRAHWLSLVTMIDQQRYQQAIDYLAAHTEFAQTQRGQEMRARISLLQHDAETAHTIYGDLQEQSAEAQVFLARSAYRDGRYEEAEQLTLRLLEQFPADQQLLASLAELQRLKADASRDKPAARVEAPPRESLPARVGAPERVDEPQEVPPPAASEPLRKHEPRDDEAPAAAKAAEAAEPRTVPDAPRSPAPPAADEAPDEDDQMAPPSPDDRRRLSRFPRSGERSYVPLWRA